MRRESDFHLSVDQITRLVLDASSLSRAAVAVPIPSPHYHRMRRVLSSLERAERDLHTLRNDPWHPPQPPQPTSPQLALL
jgi:hypothetical protein